MPMLEQNDRAETGDPLPHAAFEQQQRRRMLIALMVLLLALVAVLLKDRQFWFPPTPSADSETPDESVPPVRPASSAAKTVASIAPPKIAALSQARAKTKWKRAAATARPASTPETPFIVATNRAVLPPLKVEVVAGNQHHAISPGDSSVK